MLIDLDSLRLDGGTQPRASISASAVDEFADALLAKAAFPPVIVFHDGENYWLADGFTRERAYRRVGRKKIDADVQQGTQRDAVLFSVGANAEHGQRRTNEDKERAVLTLLRDEEWGEKSDRWIAERAKVDKNTVDRYRKKIVSQVVNSPPGSNGVHKRIGKDGKRQSATKKTAAKSQVATSPPEPPGEAKDALPLDESSADESLLKELKRLWRSADAATQKVFTDWIFQ